MAWLIPFFLAPWTNFCFWARMVSLVFFAHGLAQDVGPGEAEARQVGRDLHDLLLIDDDPARLLEDGLELGELVGDPLGMVLAVDELVGHAALQGPGR